MKAEHQKFNFKNGHYQQNLILGRGLILLCGAECEVVTVLRPGCTAAVSHMMTQLNTRQFDL